LSRLKTPQNLDPSLRKIRWERKVHGKVCRKERTVEYLRVECWIILYGSYRMGVCELDSSGSE
jgi:hypothetical protein